MDNRKLYFSIIICCLFTAACQKEASTEGEQPPVTGTVVLNFNHLVKANVLNFTDNYVNDHGEQYTVDRFKYYVHDIKLLNDKNETIPVSSEYFLVDEENTATKTITLTVPENKYTSISWLLGVDSTRNVSGAQTGTLDPTNGMFWTWTSGYIMAKLEGHSPASTLSGQVFTYHVGGYKIPYVTSRNIALTFPQNITIVKDTSVTISMNADINNWFSRVHNISIASSPACHSPGQLANDIADNYEGMFSIKEIF
jgi:hypothetical protein